MRHEFPATLTVLVVVVMLRTASLHAAPATRPTTGPASAPAAATVVEVERAPDRVRAPNGLGTAGYAPTDRERPFFERTPEDELTIGAINDNQTGYDLKARRGKRVSWFGIVRSVTRRPDGTHELLLEHKYFDGLTDLHILALSFNGAGDFTARVLADELPVRPLMLVRAYGTVDAVDGERPVLRAEYVRAFPWKTFTFIECYGKDQGNPAWRKLCKVDLDRIYNPYPDERYYRDRLGDPAD